MPKPERWPCPHCGAETLEPLARIEMSGRIQQPGDPRALVVCQCHGRCASRAGKPERVFLEELAFEPVPANVGGHPGPKLGRMAADVPVAAEKFLTRREANRLKRKTPRGVRK